jgi:hypothetical protein
MSPAKKKRVHFENIKAQHTSHWDLDYLSRAELDELYRKNRGESGRGDGKPNRPFPRKLMLAILAGATAGLLAALFILFLS